MFKRLFGETERAQKEYLQKKVKVTLIILGIGLVAGAILGLVTEVGFLYGLLYGLCYAYAITCYYWGWGALKSLFGITSLAALFSGNLVLGIVIFIFYIFISAFVGLFTAFLGIGRYIYLKAKEKA